MRAKGRPGTGPASRSARLLGFLLVLGALMLGCRQVSPRPAAAPVGDGRVMLGEPRVTPREEANGAPVDCRVEVTNQLSEQLSGLMLTCELLDGDGVSLGAGVTALPNLRPSERRTGRAVIYGVRRFASARAFVTVAGVQ